MKFFKKEYIDKIDQEKKQMEILGNEDKINQILLEGKN